LCFYQLSWHPHGIVPTAWAILFQLPEQGNDMRMEWIGPARVRYIRLRRLRSGARVWLVTFVNADETSCVPTTGDEKHEAVEPSALLLKEMDETNTWARSGAQLYFGAFTLLLTVNVLGAGWFFTHIGRMPPFTFLLFLVFIGLNLMGTIMTYRIRREMLDADDRIADVVDSLTPDLVTEDVNSRPLSPMPREAFKIAFFFAGATSFMLLVFWTVLLIWGWIAGFSSLVVGSP
jgi:hypothetical protein